MAELRRKRRALEERAEKMAGGSDEWLKAFLIQRFLVAHHNDQSPVRGARPVSYAEVEAFWAAGLIERVEALDGSLLMFADGWTLDSARAALRVRKALVHGE